MNANNCANEIFFKEGYGSFENFMFDSALIIALSKIDQYEAESDLYKDKYGMDIKNFENELHKKKGSEDFKKEEDFEDWEFSTHAVKWWKERADELRATKTR